MRALKVDNEEWTANCPSLTDPLHPDVGVAYCVTPTGYELLLLPLGNAGRMLCRIQVLKRVWGPGWFEL